MTKQEDLLQELNQNIAQLNRLLKKQNSGWYSMWLGLIRGLGGFIGTVVVTGLIIYFASRLLQVEAIQEQLQKLMQTTVQNTVSETFRNLNFPTGR
jgi:hypothetical protein